MSRAATFIALGITVTLAAYGCGSSGTGGTGGATGTGGGTSNGGATGTGGTSNNGGTTGTGGSLAACGDNTGANQGESCNTIVPTGTCVMETKSSAAAPAPAGGTIVAGTYDLPTMTVDGEPADAGLDSARRGVIMISAGTGANMFNIQVAEQSGT